MVHIPDIQSPIFCLFNNTISSKILWGKVVHFLFWCEPQIVTFWNYTFSWTTFFLLQEINVVHISDVVRPIFCLSIDTTFVKILKEKVVQFLAPLTTSAQRSWWYYWLSVVRRRPSSSVVRRPSVNFCFKSLLLLQFLFDNSEFFTGETRHIVPPCNKVGISNFCLEFQKLQKFQISWKRYSSYSSYSIILNFLLEKLGI